MSAKAHFNRIFFKFSVWQLYSIEDNKRGYMMMKGDNVAGRRSGFVHTTIGIVTNEFIRHKEASQLFNALVQVHKLAKMPSKSNYLIERPKLAGDITADFGANKRILISEKDEALTILLKTILELQGYDVIVMSDIAKISKIEEPPALIILDAGEVETLEGLSHCKALKSDNRFADSKIILTSVLHDKELVLNCGADLYLPKPYELSTLIKWVDTLLKES